MNNTKNIFWGSLLIIVGIIIALNSFGITNINLFFDGWWTLFIIVPSIIGLFNEKEKTSNVIGILFGLFLLLCAQGILSFEILFKLAFPIILVVFGVSLIFKNSKISKEKIPTRENDLEYTSTFSG